ncbi:MAG TPA: hypothetical protein VFQ53_35905 [Kofleriaceae bacterium]|nr:hypothetical protein [Kofleriaceae bacterium]
MRVRHLLVLGLVASVGCPGDRAAPSRPVVPTASAPVDASPPVVQPSATPPAAPAAPAADRVAASVIADAKAKLVAKYGAAQRDRIERGVDQVATLWRAQDGDLVAFCLEQFVAEPKARDALFERMQGMIEQINGHFLEVGRAARWGSEVEAGPMLPVDGLLAAYDPSAHVTEDLFASKVAFAALLNFPLTKLADRMRDSASYTRRQWAEVRLTGHFDTRIPGQLAAAASAAEAAADQYIAGYNLWMHHVLGEDGKRRFPAKKRLISHWNLRDELKANYADGAEGVAKQRTIAKLMERIVTQTIPRAVIDNPNLDWNPFTNKVVVAEAGTIEADAPKDRAKTPSDEREPDTRFSYVRNHFLAARAIDPYSPIAPTRIERAFEAAEIPEDRVRKMLVEILDSPLATDAAKEIEQKLGRKLEPQDIWYEFGGGATPEAKLDALTRKRYPTAAAFAKDLPRIFRGLGFTDARAKYLTGKIEVDPSRGAGHAMGAERRGDKAHLRTRVEPGGMDYKGYNIAIHELGHNVEQTFSLYDVDYTLLSGVPNTAFTEALAFLFQARDLELLGQPKPGGEAERMRVLDAYWNTREIAGSALVELDVWHWLYAHPNASAGELREATVKIARDVWNRYYAPTLGGKDSALLGIYSHTIASPLYLFNYVLGHLIAFQVEEHLAGKPNAVFAKEFERICRIGAILPDAWMQQATGKPVTTQPLLDAAARALKKK